MDDRKSRGSHAALSVSLTPGLPGVPVLPLHFIVQPQGVECRRCRFEGFFLKIAKNLLSLCQEIRKRSRQTTKKGNSLQTLPESSQHTHAAGVCWFDSHTENTNCYFLSSLFKKKFKYLHENGTVRCFCSVISFRPDVVTSPLDRNHPKDSLIFLYKAGKKLKKHFFK